MAPTRDGFFAPTNVGLCRSEHCTGTARPYPRRKAPPIPVLRSHAGTAAVEGSPLPPRRPPRPAKRHRPTISSKGASEDAKGIHCSLRVFACALQLSAEPNNRSTRGYPRSRCRPAKPLPGRHTLAQSRTDTLHRVFLACRTTSTGLLPVSQTRSRIMNAPRKFTWQSGRPKPSIQIEADSSSRLKPTGGNHASPLEWTLAISRGLIPRRRCYRSIRQWRTGWACQAHWAIYRHLGMKVHARAITRIFREHSSIAGLPRPLSPPTSVPPPIQSHPPLTSSPPHLLTPSSPHPPTQSHAIASACASTSSAARACLSGG